MIKSAVITSFLSRTKDRFHEYNEEKTFEERLQLVASMKNINGIETVYPYEIKDPREGKKHAEKFGLHWAAVNVNVKAEPEFRNGGLTSPRREVQEKAVRFIREAKDFAYEVGADKVSCCPLGDGYEFHFQSDYRACWKRLIENLGEAAAYRPEIPLFIEYKPSETRGRCYVDSAAKTLCLLNDIGVRETGVTIDFGHSIWAGEMPAEAVSLIGESPYGMYIHINDNDSRWDWDYFVGTRNFLAYVEFLFFLQEYEYQDYFTSDTSPTRWDIAGTFETNARMTNNIVNMLDNIDRNELKHLMSADNYLETWRFIEQHILHLGSPE